MQNEGISINNLLRELGYDPKYYSQWLQNILQKKEDFKKDYILTPRKTEGRDKATETLVRYGAKTLVDNLCFLKPYTRMFPRNVKDVNNDADFMMYQNLRDGEYDYIHDEVIKHKNKLLNHKKMNDNALADLEPFYAALDSTEKIDLKTQSLRELMNKFRGGFEIYEHNPNELACWHDIIKLQEQLDENPDNCLLHRKLAEVWYNLNQYDESLEHLDDCLELSPEDGIAWAIRAKILLEQLEEKKESHKLAYYDQDSSPYSSSMTRFNIELILPEDFWQPTTDNDLCIPFVDAAFKALQFWPTDELTMGCVDNCSNYCGNYCGCICENYLWLTDEAPDCDISISRDFLFFHLVLNIKKKDLSRKQMQYMLDLLREFQSPNTLNSFPILNFKQGSPEATKRVLFLIKLTQLIKLISTEEYNSLLESFVQDFIKDKRHAGRNIEMLTRSIISHDFWEYLGPDEFSRLHERLWDYVKQSERDDRFSSIFSHAWRSIHDPLTEPTLIYQQFKHKFMLKSWQADWGPQFPDYSPEEVALAFAKGATKSFSKKESLAHLLDESLLFNTKVDELPPSFRQTISLLALLEYNLTGNETAKDLIGKLVDNPDILCSCFFSENAYLVDLFDEFWSHPSVHPEAVKPEALFKAIRSIVNQNSCRYVSR